jgi:integrase
LATWKCAIHDGTLQDFIRNRLASGVTPTTINRTLEVVRTVLNRAARVYRDDKGRPWLEGVPPLITMLAENRRPPYPITWEEQDRLFAKLPARVARMALFAVNTGLRESNLCGLEWAWEVAVPEVGRSVFVIPPQAFKSKRAHVVILNDVAWSIVQEQRGKHPIWVFPYRGKAVRTINNTAWQRARRESNLRPVRVHDLRHVCVSAARRGCLAGRPRSATRSREPFDGGALRERGRRSSAQASESNLGSAGDAHGVARRLFRHARAVDKGSRSSE